MNVARDRTAIAQLSATLAGDFDLPTVLDSVAHDACEGFAARAVALVLLDTRHRVGEAGIQVVAESLHEPIDADLGFVTTGPALVTARDGAVTMIGDLAAEDTRWPRYRRDALQAGMRGMRSFPLKVLGSPVGALVVHTEDPWGDDRVNDVGQTLANLAAVAISIAPHLGQRRADTSETIDTLLEGTVVIATATGILAELAGTEPAQARVVLQRLARAHQLTVTAFADKLVATYDDDPSAIRGSVLLAPPVELPPPTRIDT